MEEPYAAQPYERAYFDHLLEVPQVWNGPHGDPHCPIRLIPALSIRLDASLAVQLYRN